VAEHQHPVEGGGIDGPRERDWSSRTHTCLDTGVYSQPRAARQTRSPAPRQGRVAMQRMLRLATLHLPCSLRAERAVASLKPSLRSGVTLHGKSTALALIPIAIQWNRQPPSQRRREDENMAIAPHYLWFSVTIPEGRTVTYELPDQDDWFTRADWDKYRELAALAMEHHVSMVVSDARGKAEDTAGKPVIPPV
jgi:hypothetical protein